MRRQLASTIHVCSERPAFVKRNNGEGQYVGRQGLLSCQDVTGAPLPSVIRKTKCCKRRVDLVIYGSSMKKQRQDVREAA